MKKNIRLKSSILALVAGFSVMATQTALADELAVQLIGVNDFHGALDTTGTARLEGETVRNAGTAALLGTYMDDAETEFKAETAEKQMPAESIRVQAGDMVGASPSNSALLQDEPTVKVLNKMKIDYGTLGNHEFDEGLEEYNRIMTGQAPEPGKFNPIVDNYKREAATQEMVIANVVDKKTGEIPYGWKPYAIKTVPINDKEAKIGFIGVVTTEIPNLVLKKNYEQYTFLDEAETIAKYARELTDKEGVKAIVVLAHVPATSKDGVAAGESADMIEKLNRIYPENSVDVVFAGHNHVHTNGTTGKTLIVQATSQGKAYADVRAIYDTDIADFKAVPTAKVVAVAPGKKTPNPEIQAIVDEANVIVKQVTEQKIGTASQATDISREVNEFKESAVGNLVTTAQLAIAKKSGYDVDFAMTNDGGIRADLKVQADGSVTWGAAQAVQPFGNILQIVQMTGEQIYTALNQQYDEGEKYFLQLSGLKYIYTVADNPTADNPYKVAKAFKEDGTEIDPAKTYTVVINDFLLGGGDGFSIFKDAKLIGAINPDTEVFIEYLNDLKNAGQSISAAIMGRKTFVKQYVEEPKVGEKPDSSSSTNQDNSSKANISNEEKMDDKSKSQGDKNQTGGITAKTDQKMAKKATGKQALPKTGQAELTSFFISLGGLVSLGMAVSVRRKENQ
ncbi:surface-anchored 5'-nucleotidase [Streptococcus ruminantium]|uniref:surface-anchored 5'-nucleotidase n=1 Tax=Streptococcus ruminantium TaxID=1917441 RepID=UPI000421C97A|nr:bifunctional metallophosphatase/5'-nucleotidase [Streptococcus ruminantium]BDD39097.1 5'-nucleotidase [Streptococcus ruminantium]